MYKLFRRILLCCVIISAVYLYHFLSDWQQMSDSLIRFHVVASSDSRKDQAVKLKVRDAVLESIQGDLQQISDISEAKRYLEENIPKIQKIVSQTLTENGFSGASSVSLCRETFGTRHYETFSLPAGVYESLRIVIGDGNGKNWWCVAFPQLCVPATSSQFKDMAAGSGFHETIVETLSGSEQYVIHFYLLDKVGTLKNIFFQG